MLTASNGTPKQELDAPKASPAPTPDNWKGVRNGLSRAEQCLNAQELDQAERHIREVLEFAPSEARAWDLLASLFQIRGIQEEAKRCRDKAESLRKWETDSFKQPPASIRLAKLLWRQGDKETARAMLAVLMIRQPEDERLHALRDIWFREE